MSGKKNNNGINIIVFILFFGIIAIVWMIKKIIEGIVYLIVLIKRKIQKNKILKQKEELKERINNINSIKSNIEEIKNDELKEMKQYNELFDRNIQIRGLNYYCEDKVQDMDNQKLHYSAKVKGTEDYCVSIDFKESDKSQIDQAICTCKYYEENHKYCKHIYATLLNVIYGVQSIDVLIYKNKRDKELQELEIDQEEEEKTRDKLSKNIKQDKEKVNKININIINNIQRPHNQGTVSSALTAFAISNEIDKMKNQRKSTRIEKECDAYNLDDYEKELVKKGDYAPTGFETDGKLSDDDYYKEDNK